MKRALRIFNLVLLAGTLLSFIISSPVYAQTVQTCEAQGGSCITGASCPWNLPNQITPTSNCPGPSSICCGAAPQPCLPEGTKKEGVLCDNLSPGCCEGLYCTEFTEKQCRTEIPVIVGSGAVAPTPTVICEEKKYAVCNNPASVNKGDEPEPVYFNPQVSIPGSVMIGGKEFSVKTCEPGQKISECGILVDGSTAQKYFAVFYRFFVAALVVVAVVMVMWGGFKRIMAAGAPERIKDANDTIMGAISGIVIALLSYSILSLINPELVSFKSLDVYNVKQENFTLEPEEPITTTSVPPADLVAITEHPNLYLDSDTKRYPYLRADTLAKLMEAANLATQQNITIELNYAARSLEEQERLYKKNCSNGNCNPPTCNPNGNINRCPHTTGAAVDVTCKGVSSSNPCQTKLEAILLQVGFCRLTSEAWHFEYPKFSSKCTITR